MTTFAQTPYSEADMPQACRECPQAPCLQRDKCLLVIAERAQTGWKKQAVPELDDEADQT